jgi:adenine phosphoribosyltransferase
MKSTEQLRHYIINTPDFPKAGILFRDIQPILDRPTVFKFVIREMAKRVPLEATCIAALDARGFIFGAALALKCGLPFVMVRKAGKLPGNVLTQQYGLEYGSDSVQIQADCIEPSDKVVVVDDVLATGGTAGAAQALVHQAGGTVCAFVFLVELKALKGRLLLGKNIPVYSLVTYA